VIQRAQKDALIVARAVSKVFGRGVLSTPVLHEVSLELPPGQLTLLMGPSGSGKTTLISILVGVLRPSSGAVELCGRTITELSENEVSRVRRQSVGFVFQTDNLFPALSAFDNVAEVLRMKGRPRDEAHTLARRALERVGLAHRLAHKPGEMSGGQRQRVAIARALADSPSRVVGDEVTAPLDGATAQSVMELLREQVTPTTSALIVTHDRRLDRFADRVIEMEDGRLMRDSSAHAFERGRG
jgi:putative ABC transport system ATP-binding protein